MMNDLFDITLQYCPEMSAVTSSIDRIGKRLGSGNGSVKGDKIKGTVRWDIYEKGGVVSGKNRCQTNIAGVIKTEDGSEIEFDSTGFGMIPNPDRANEWSMAAAINFFTAEPRYRWLNKVIGVWSGNFDMRTGQHRYKVYFES